MVSNPLVVTTRVRETVALLFQATILLDLTLIPTSTLGTYAPGGLFYNVAATGGSSTPLLSGPWMMGMGTLTLFSSELLHLIMNDVCRMV